MKTPKKSNDITTLLGGVEIEVVHLPSLDDLHESDQKRLGKFQTLFGTKEIIKIRHVLVSQQQRYSFAILNRDEAAAVEIYCGKEPGWADTLTLESVNAVADKGLELNLPFFSASFRRQMKWQEATTPQAIVDLQKRLEEMETLIHESRSPTSSSPTALTTG